MTLRQYTWKDGPAEIQQHSIAKHCILRSYLAAYFQTLISSPKQEVLRLTLVDGFAGGGQYYHADSGELVQGSPLIFLQATKEAEFLLNQDRRKPVRLEVDYFFVEACGDAFKHLEMVLKAEGYGPRIGKDIHVIHGKFQEAAPQIVEFVKKKSPKKGRSIFALDQYGYTDVPTPLIRTIFQTLSSAEVILTFAVDSFVNYASDGKLTQALMDRIGLPDVLQGRTISDIKSSDRHWRLWIQSALYRGLVDKCGASHYTPFFIRNRRGHGDYWLIHLSNHFKARDVMTEVHWQNNNYFIHYGGAGLDMFSMVGYDPAHDAAFKMQNVLGFEFDDVAKRASLASLLDDLPRRIYANDEGMSFGELFASTCNNSPACAAFYRESLASLAEAKEIEIVGTDGAKRRAATQIKLSDQILPPSQRSFNFLV